MAAGRADAQPAPAGGGMPPAAANPAAATPFERLIYLPYKNIRQVLDKQPATVFLPYSEFIKIWERAYSAAQADRPPVDVAITKAAYKGRIENDLARIEAVYTIQSLHKRWAELPLRFGDAAVGEMTCEDPRVLLRGLDDGSYGLVFPEKGTYVVTFQLATRVRTATDGRSFELEVPASGVSNFELTVPSPDQTVEILPHQVSTAVEGTPNTTKVEARIGAARRVTARWYPRVGDVPEMELLATVNNVEHVRVADGLVFTEATLTYQILRGQLDQVKIAVPLGQRILDVAAPNLKGWKVEAESNRQLLTVDLLSGASKTVPVEVRTERPLAAGALDTAGLAADGTAYGIHSLGAVRESGVLVIGQGADLALTVERQEGLVRVEPGEAPETLRRPENQFYKFYSPSFRLVIAVRPVEPRLLVDHMAQIEVHEDDVRVTSSFRFVVEKAGVFELVFNIPEGLQIEQVDCNRKKEFVTSTDGKAIHLLLTERTLGEIDVVIRGRRALPREGNQNWPLPVIEPAGAAREQGNVHVYAQEAFEIVSEDQAVVGAQPDRLRTGGSLGALRLAAAWTYTRRPLEIPVRVVRKPTILTADVATTVDVQLEVVKVTTLLNYKVEHAGVSVFRFLAHESIPADLQIDSNSGVAIQQRTRSATAADGWYTWTVTLQREVSGDQQFRVTYDLLPEKQEDGLDAVVRPLQVLGLVQPDGAPAGPSALRKGELAVTKDRVWSLTTTPTDLETIDLRELTLLSQDGALAYRYSRQPASLALSARKHEIQEVVQTVVSKQLVEAVIGEDDTVNYRVRYAVRTSERQRLALELPKGIEVLGVVVSDKPVTLERDAGRQAEGDYDAYFVNVARAGRSEDRFFLTLVYRKKEKVFSAVMLGGRLNVEFPRLGSPGTVAVQQMRAAVWAPKEFTLVGTPDQFTVERTATWRQALWGTKPPGARQDELESWIGGGSTGLFEFPVAGYGTEYHNLGGAEKLEVSFWRSAWVTGILSVGCLAIGFVLARSTWENRLGVVLSAAVATAVYGLFDSDAMVYWVSTSRYGLLGAAAWWVVSALLTIPLPSRAPLAAVGSGTGTETTAATSENAAPAAGSTAGDAAMPPGTVTPPAAGHAFQEPEGTGGGDSAADA